METELWVTLWKDFAVKSNREAIKFREGNVGTRECVCICVFKDKRF